jgi:hypothetical protein
VLSESVFFSFTEVTDPTAHRAYNEWHQLDHRPENLALPGVLHGERWVRSPDCRSIGVSAAGLDRVDYVNMYWFRSPSAPSIEEWQGLAERSFQWGRRPDIPIAVRSLMGFFQAVRGYCAPRVLVSPDALPFRPALGVYVQLSRLPDPSGAVTQELFRWYDREWIPALLEGPGAAGAWTFASGSTTFGQGEEEAGATTFRPMHQDFGRFRLLLIYLDADPVEACERLQDKRNRAVPAELASAEEIIMASPLRTICPWQWGWFDLPGSTGS